MSRKHVIVPYKLFNNIDASVTTTSKETSISEIDNIEFIISWSGTGLLGEILVQVASEVKDDPDATVWVDLDFGSQIAISGASGSHLVNINQKCGNKIRLKWVPSAGTGTLQAIITAKTVGA